MANFNGRGRPTAGAVRLAYDYDPVTGNFARRMKMVGRPSRHPTGVGGIDGYGYHRLNVNGAQYKAHLIAWLHHYGEWPAGEIDHINGVRDDNRIVNLRVCSHQQNQANRSVQRNNALGMKGVCAMRMRSGRIRYRALVTTNGKAVVAGYFDTPHEAAEAYAEAAARLHGEFARV